MLTLITGMPGSGKSAALVSMLQEIAKGRAIYVDGIPDLQIEHQPLPDPTQWPDVVPDGSVIVIDEVQRVWRPRGPGQKVPADVAALETHRHRGLDIYVVTQSPRLVDVNVRSLVGRHVHLRELGIFGRWWYEWPECADNCATAWKNAPIKKRYKLPKKIFDKYKSASVHIKPVRSFPRVLVVFTLALIGLAGLSWRVYARIQENMHPEAVAALPSLNSEFSETENVSHLGNSSILVIDDRVAFIPRISSKPETAPAYDHLREVKTMPLVAGGACGVRDEVYTCTCYTQQGTNAGLSHGECEEWMKNPPFNPYVDPERHQLSESRVAARSSADGEEGVAPTPATSNAVRIEESPILPRMNGGSI